MSAIKKVKDETRGERKFKVRSIAVGRIMRQQGIMELSDFRKALTEPYNKARETFIVTALNGAGVKYATDMTKAEKEELFESNRVSILVEDDVDVIRVNGVIVGLWKNKKEVVMSKSGLRLVVSFWLK